MNKFHYFIATVFGIGKFPFGPGTCASLAALPFCLLLHGSPVIYGILFLVLFFLGIFASGHVSAKTGIADPSFVVIDEFACMFPVFMFMQINIFIVITGFTLYRAFDILKPPPIAQLEHVKGGWGIMLDDLAAAIFSNLILQCLIVFKIL